jgi:hypothetical protein
MCNSDKSRVVASETRLGMAQNVIIAYARFCYEFYCVNKGGRNIYVRQRVLCTVARVRKHPVFIYYYLDRRRKR